MGIYQFGKQKVVIDLKHKNMGSADMHMYGDLYIAQKSQSVNLSPLFMDPLLWMFSSHIHIDR